MEFIVVYVTARDLAEGRKIVQHLLAQKLAACVNIVSGVESHYHWEGRLEQSAEVLLMIKTRKTLFERLSKSVKDVHSYSVPEIIALPIVEGEKNYLAWLGEETKEN